MSRTLSITAEATWMRVFRVGYLAIAGTAVALGASAIVLAPLRAGVVGLIVALIALLFYFVEYAVALSVWGAVSLLPFTKVLPSLGRAMRRRTATLDRPTLALGVVLLPFFVGFIALDHQAGKAAQSAWGGYAMALLFAFMCAVVAPLIGKARYGRAPDADRDGPLATR